MKDRNYPTPIRVPRETRNKLNEMFPNKRIGLQIQQAVTELHAIKTYSELNKTEGE